MLATLIFLACQSGDKAPTGDSAPPQESAIPDAGDSDTTDSDRADSAPTDSGDAPVESVPGEGLSPEACDALYDQDAFPNFNIEISDDEWTALLHDWSTGRKRYHPVVFHYGDEEVDDAEIRLKGNPSFSWIADKMQFVIAFNQANPDGRFHGLRKLSLDAPWYDATLLHDRLGWSILRRAEQVPSVCANSATLSVNGELYGVYTNIEYLDHEWLERVYGSDDTGTLWKYGTDAVANEDAATGAVHHMARANTVAKLEELGDLDEWVMAFAAEIVVGDDDGYWCCGHNFYLYEHPTLGVQFVPWDLDLGFDFMGYDTDPILGYDSPYTLFQQRGFTLVANDPTWGPKLVDAVETLNAALDPETAVADLDTWDAQISDALYAEPHRSVGLEEHQTALERLKAWLPARHAYLESWVACARGETTDADGDGAPVCDDPDDGDAAVSPTGIESCNGVDDDANGLVDDLDSCDDCARHDLGTSHFLFCRYPRTWLDASAHCEGLGGTLSSPATTAEMDVFYVYTWPGDQRWWSGAEGARDRCTDWDPTAWSTGFSPCTDELPSTCRLP